MALDDLETFTERQGNLCFASGHWSVGKLMNTLFGNGFTNYSWSYQQHVKFVQLCSQIRQGIVETADSRLCTGEIGKPTTGEKMERRSFVV